MSLMTPEPHQIAGAAFLAARRVGMLADEQRVGKTGPSIMAADDIFATPILVVTTSSGRPNWAAQFKNWGAWPRKIQVVYGNSEKLDPTANVVIVSWQALSALKLYPQLWARRWALLIADESHYAGNWTSKRTVALFGEKGLHTRAARVWPLSGTAIPNDPSNLYPMMHALLPERLKASAAQGWPDVTELDDFVKCYCVTYIKKVGWQRLRIVLRGKNEAELAARLDGFWLRRELEDVGIMRPVFEQMLLHVDKLESAQAAELAAASANSAMILKACRDGNTKQLDMNLGQLRRLTGPLKASLIQSAVREEFEAGLDKIVLACWHTETIDLLKAQLSQFGVVGIDGRTNPTRRQAEIDKFNSGDARVFVGQIVAAGEAIDLSSAAELIFVEPSFTPKDMSQMAMRIVNMGQRRQPRVRLAALEGSIDEAVTAVLLRKVASIKTIQEQAHVG